MKKIYLTIVACVAMAFSANAVEEGEANIYASGLKVNGNNLEFVLNATPTEVQVVFKDENDAVVKSITVDDAKKGVNTISLEGVFNNVKANASLKWEVVATAEANNVVKLFSDESAASQMIAYPTHIAVDRNPKSSFYGRIYVNEGNAYTYSAQNRTTSEGVYIFNAAFEDETMQGQKAWNGGVSWVNNGWKYSSPCMLYVADNGDVFISDWTDSNSGVWVMNPAKPSENFRPVFGGVRNNIGLVSENSVDIHGSISGICVLGEGKDRVLYTYDEDLGTPGSINKYNIGDFESPWVSAPSSVWYDNVDEQLIGGQSAVLRSDGRGGFWVSHHRYANDTYSMLVHINENAQIDYETGSDNTLSITANDNYGMDISPDGKLIALACSKSVLIYEVSYDVNTGIPSLSLKEEIDEKVSTKCFGVAFDAVGNIYLADNSDHIRAFALPKAVNSSTTEANEAVIVNDEMTGIADVAVDANAPVEYYNIQGVKVENPVNGIFVKKQAGKAIKVIL